MKKRLFGFLSLLLALILIISLVPPVPADAATSTAAMGAVIDAFTANDSSFAITSSSRFYIVSDTEPDAELQQTVQLVQRQFAADGKDLTIVWGPERWIADGDIVIRLKSSAGIGAEGYRWNVTTRAEITASDVDGLLYGLNMLQKHLRSANWATIQGFTAQDVPDTKERTVSLDCGRKYYTKDWICNFIREMSWMGYNTIQLHFSDDAGFRFDLWDPAYYTDQFNPKNDFSWICGGHYTSWTLSAYQVVDNSYLSTAEVIEILNTAKEYHIDVIPSFDSPAHLDYLTWKYEQNYDGNTGYSFYSTYDQTTYYASKVSGIINYTNSKDWSTAMKWPYYAAIDVTKDQAKAFIFELYIDIANFFKEYAGSTDFSIGADEVQLNTANLASGYSYKWGFPEFVSYINELNTLLRGKGYTMRMYNDFLGSTTYGASGYEFADNIEIQYWNSPFIPTSGGEACYTEPVSYFVNQGRVLYNCIQTNTYYALRISKDNWYGSDARSESNRAWTFYHSTEEAIWDEWYTADISEHGDLCEDVADVPAANLGGGYFLIWCDYACVSTEQDIWNGCYDKTNPSTGEFYSLRDRMWSNITKMWNWDVNDTVTFANFVTVRDAYGDHPGLGSGTTACSSATTLPAAVTVSAVEAEGHAELHEKLATKHSSQYYTAESYANYEAAYNAAVEVDNNVASTAAQIAAAMDALTAAEKALVIKGNAVYITFKALIDGNETILGTLQGSTETNSLGYNITLAGIPGYAVDYVIGSTFVAGDSDNVTGTLQGSAVQDLYVVVWYKSILDTAFLDDLVADAITDQSSYTDESWATYQTALTKARSFTVTANTRQADVDALAKALADARTALVVAAPETTITVEKLTPKSYRGKQVGLRITMTPDVASLTIRDSAGNSETLTLCTAQVQTLNDGKTVKIWLIYFPADEAGSFTYTISGENASATVDIEVI